MKIIEMAKRAITRKPIAFDIEKAAATFISRPLLNAQKWHDWAVKWGVPNVVPVAEMHVTQMSSTTQLMAPLVETAMNIDATSGIFAFFGDEDDCLVFTFSSWTLYDRNWDLRAAGATPTWPSFRPHLTLSYDAAGFTLPDDAMTDVPGMIVLGPEVLVSGPVDPSDQLDADDDSPVTVVQIACSAAESLLTTERDKLPTLVAYDLADIAKNRATSEVVKRVAAADWAPAELKALKSATPPPKPYGDVEYADPKDGKYPIDTAEHIRAAWDYIHHPHNAAAYSASELSAIKGRIIAAWKAKIDKAGPPSAETATAKKRVEVDYTVKVSALPEEIRKTGIATARTRDIAKADGQPEDQIVMGIASVSTMKGELVKDLHGDEVTTRALVEFNRSIIAGTRAGKFEHEGEQCTSVVAGLVLTEDWQKSLGIDLGYEPYLVEIHVPVAKDWAEVKDGDWELSIAGTMWHWEEAPADAEV